ncbi:outer membrane lipoprotein-sorting protein [Halosimplex sp. J119]
MTDERGSLGSRVAPLAVGAVAVALLAVVAAGALPTGDTAPDAEEVLDRAEQRYDSAESVAGDATVTAENATVERSLNLSFVVQQPDSSRVSVTRDGSERVFGTNGTVAWVYDPANDTVRVRELPDNESAWNRSDAAGDGSWDGNHTWNGSQVWTGDDEPEKLANGSVDRFLDGNVSAEVRRTATLDGAETYVVGLEPTNRSHRGNATLWVDTDDYRVHRVRASDGENRTTVDFAGVKFNVSAHESTFQPPNASSVNTVSQERYGSFAAAQDATSIALQRLDAEGYDFEEATVVTRNGQTVVAQQYTGEANVTVVATGDDPPYEVNASDGEPVEVNGVDATYVERDDRSAVVWEDGAVTRTVVGDLPRDELVALAGRMAG